MDNRQAKLVTLAIVTAAALIPHTTVAMEMGGAVWTGKAGWDYAPSHMVDQLDGNREKMWWCGEADGNSGVDAVYYSVFIAGHWVVPKIALRDLKGPCDPTVIRGDFRYPVAGRGSRWSYVMYLDQMDSSGVQVAVSTTGAPGTWILIGSAFTSPFHLVAYMGQPTAFRSGSGVDLVYTDRELGDPPHYYMRYSPDGFNFGKPTEVTRRGISFLSWRNPSWAFAVSDDAYWMATVDATSDGSVWGMPTGIGIYRIPVASIRDGYWSKVGDVTPGTVKAYQFEPGFKTDSYGSIQTALPYVSLAFGCESALEGASGDDGSDICGAVGYVGF